MKKFSLSQSERVKKEKDFQKIYSKGKTLYSSQKKLKLVYCIESSVNYSGIKAAFVVSRKSGNAVWRNRIKRLLRESFRLNKHEILELCFSKNLLLFLSFSPGNLNQKQCKRMKLDFIIQDFMDLLEKVKEKVEDE